MKHEILERRVVLRLGADEHDAITALAERLDAPVSRVLRTAMRHGLVTLRAEVADLEARDAKVSNR